MLKENNQFNVSYASYEKGPKITYIRSGIFKFKGIEFNIDEARFIADTIGEMLTGESFLITKNLPTINNNALIKIIDKRLHSSDIPFTEAPNEQE